MAFQNEDSLEPIGCSRNLDDFTDAQADLCFCCSYMIKISRSVMVQSFDGDLKKVVIFDPQNDVIIGSLNSLQEKDDYGALIEQLGGKLLEAQMFDCRCTHLVISEYYLSCLGLPLCSIYGCSWFQLLIQC